MRRWRQDTTSRDRALRLRQQFEQHRQRRFYGRDDAGSPGHDRGGVGVIGDLEQRGRAVEDRGTALDMEGKGGRADHDHHIMIAQRVRELPGRGMQEACELPVSLRKTAARRKRADPHRSFGLFGDAHHQIDRLCTVDAGADHQRRALAGRERRRQRFHCRRLGTPLAADRARFDGVRLMGPVVDRHRDKGRSAGRLHRHVIGARDRCRHVFGPRRLDRVFDVGPRKFRGALGIEKRLQRQQAARLLARGNHQRGLVAVRGIEIAERVADAGGGMQIDKTGIAGGLRVAIGHADHGCFLQPQHIVDIPGPVGEERQFGRAGIAEHFLDAERAQEVESGVLDADGSGFC